MYIKQL